ncbi:MAG: DUF2752 domain-containing protein [Candidatus Aminicenantaceae bacterium]
MPHIIVLSVCFLILAGALILSPADSENPYIRIGGIPLPDTCTFRNLTGLPCPGCGLTRSIVSAMHGDLAMSFTFHRLGLLTLVYVFIQFVYRLGLIFIPRWRPRIVLYGKFLSGGIILLGILFALNWIFVLL